ncbi:MAG: Galactose-phosphate uridylyltransferase [Thermoleophilia bacterium]|nr:Galactose-phosphate uridylyltransferase [Thermoleophilia bacterium]
MLRRDPITGVQRLVAPGRASDLRPTIRGCPFCAGNEGATPASTGERARRESTPTDAVWSARAFPNRFPLTDPHELVVPSPRHCTSWRDLALPELQDGLSLLLERRAALQTASPERYVHAFANDGPAAGASVAHVHAQLVVLDRGAHTERLVANVRDEGSCAICGLLDDPELLVERGRHHAVIAHPTPRLAGGLLLVPTGHRAAPDPDRLAEFAELLHRAWMTLDADTDANCWLVADEAAGAHWYLELQPRGANLAGVELALGLNVSAADARETAQLARTRLGKPSPRA